MSDICERNPQYLRHKYLRASKYKNKECGYDEGLPFPHREEITNFCFSLFHFLCVLFSLELRHSCLEIVSLNIKRKWLLNMKTFT